jgi:geranylgeranyl pyrophosphate synthase
LVYAHPPQYQSKKGFCEDFDEGKFSLPLIHLLSHTCYPDHEIKRHILAEMEEAQTLDYTREVLKYLHEELMHALDETEDRLGVNKGVRMLLLGLGPRLLLY